MMIKRLMKIALINPQAFKEIARGLPADTVEMIERMVSELQPAGVLPQPQASPQEPPASHSVHSSGKVCGHVHRSQEKAESCRLKLGEGWNTQEIKQEVLK